MLRAVKGWQRERGVEEEKIWTKPRKYEKQEGPPTETHTLCQHLKGVRGGHLGLHKTFSSKHINRGGRESEEAAALKEKSRGARGGDETSSRNNDTRGVRY